MRQVWASAKSAAWKRSPERGIELNSRNWDETVRRLGTSFHTPASDTGSDIIPNRRKILRALGPAADSNTNTNSYSDG